jgi:hypothetical protein
MAAAPKKRPAASQGGPKPKKAHVDKAATKSDKKRSRPVTLPARDVPDASESDEDLEEEVEAFDEELDQDEFPMEVDDAPANKTPKDPAGPFSVLPVGARLNITQRAVRHIKPKKSSKSNGGQQSRTRLSSPTPSACGVRRTPKMSPRRTDKSISTTLWMSSGARSRTSSSSTTPAG